MGWTAIADEAVDAGSPTPSSLAIQYRDNAEYNYDHALRCGTNDTGVRLVIARGEKAFNDTGTDLDFSSAVTFATDSTDGAPAFAAAPRVFLRLEEDLTGDSWTDNSVQIKRLFVQSGSLDASGFTAEWNATQSGSTNVKGTLHWMAVGTAAASSVFTTIAGTDTDQDSPFEEDMTTQLRDNQVYNHDSAVRCGTHRNGVRLALARGVATFSMDGLNGADDFVQVTFASDADDGDPNFLSPPVVILSLEEDTSADDDWTTNNAVVNRMHVSFTDEGGTYVSVDKDYFYYSLEIHDGNVLHNFGGNLHWLAIGPVTAGE